MKKKHSLKLIEGQFTPSQTHSVLLSLIANKINYHNLENFSIRERFNSDVSHQEKRITELRQAASEVDKIVNYTSDKGLNLEIECSIEIKFIK